MRMRLHVLLILLVVLAVVGTADGKIGRRREKPRVITQIDSNSYAYQKSVRSKVGYSKNSVSNP